MASPHQKGVLVNNFKVVGPSFLLANIIADETSPQLPFLSSMCACVYIYLYSLLINVIIKCKYRTQNCALTHAMQSTKDGKEEAITLNTKAINIIWGGESCEGRYWRRTAINSFEVAELVSVYWLEVTGKVPLSMFNPGTTYKLVALKLKPGASGWDNSPVIFSLQMPGEDSSRPVKLHPYMGLDWVDVPEGGMQFTVPENASGELCFAMYEIKGDKWKKGLMIKEVKFIKV